MMKKILIIFLLFFSFTRADISSWSEGLVMSATESAGYTKSQTRGYYTLGSARVSLGGQGSFSLAHIEMPKLTVGCGGIDATFGGFSYIADPKYLIAKLKAIGTAALAYEFKMAISTMCKDCSEIMDSLEGFANAVNSFNLDTCALGKTVADKSMNFFTDARQTNLVSGQTHDPIGEDGKSAKNTYADYIDSVGKKLEALKGWTKEKAKIEAKKMIDDKAALGSFLSRAIKERDKTSIYSSAFWGKDARSHEGIILGVIRYLIGDMRGYISPIDGTIKYEIVSPAVDVDKVLENFIYGNDIQYKTFNSTSNTIESKTALFTGGLNETYKRKLTSIVNNMRSFTPLSSADRKFINQQPLPIYKILNVVAVQNNNDLLDQAAEQLAINQSMVILNHILWVAGTDLSAELQRTSSKQSSEVVNGLKDIINNIQKVKQLAQLKVNSKMKKFKENRLFMNTVRDYEQQIKTQSQSKLLQMMNSY